MTPETMMLLTKGRVEEETRSEKEVTLYSVFLLHFS